MPAFYTELLDRLRALPGVVDASLNSCPPLGGGCYRTPIEFPDRAKVDCAQCKHSRELGHAKLVCDAACSARARTFDSRARIELGAPKVVLINEAAARTFWPGEEPDRQARQYRRRDGGSDRHRRRCATVRRFAGETRGLPPVCPVSHFANDDLRPRRR